MQSLSAEISGRTFDIARRGYHVDQVDAFLTDVAQQVSEMEDDLRASAVRVAALQRQVDLPKEASQSIEAAYLAASEAKQDLLEDARKKAEAIIARAEKEAVDITRNPSLLAEEVRTKAEDVLIQAKRRLEQAEAEAVRATAAAAAHAEKITADAEAEAARVLADARRDAVVAVAAAEDEAKRRLDETERRYRDLAGRLEGLRSAIDSMLDRGAQESEQIRLVLEDSSVLDGVPASTSRAARVVRDIESGRPSEVLPGG